MKNMKSPRKNRGDKRRLSKMSKDYVGVAVCNFCEKDWPSEFSYCPDCGAELTKTTPENEVKRDL